MVTIAEASGPIPRPSAAAAPPATDFVFVISTVLALTEVKTSFAEALTGIALVLGICSRYAALGAAAVLAMAVYALQTVKGFGWTWNTGGYEYPVFWAISCIVVAMNEWKPFTAPKTVPRTRLAA